MSKNLLFLFLAAFCIGCGEHTGKTTSDNIITEKEVVEFINSYDDMWANRDTNAMKDAMAEDYIYFTSTGNTTDRKRIISWFTPADKYKVDTAIRSEINVILNGNVAVVSSRWIGSGSFDGENFKDDQRCSLTIQKLNGKLKLISEHCTQIVNQH
jgi:ketosteroid isomerase-like protein